MTLLVGWHRQELPLGSIVLLSMFMAILAASHLTNGNDHILSFVPVRRVGLAEFPNLPKPLTLTAGPCYLSRVESGSADGFFR